MLRELSPQQNLLAPIAVLMVGMLTLPGLAARPTSGEIALDPVPYHNAVSKPA